MVQWCADREAVVGVVSAVRGVVSVMDTDTDIGAQVDPHPSHKNTRSTQLWTTEC